MSLQDYAFHWRTKRRHAFFRTNQPRRHRLPHPRRFSGTRICPALDEARDCSALPGFGGIYTFGFLRVESCAISPSCATCSRPNAEQRCREDPVMINNDAQLKVVREQLALAEHA